MSPVRVVRNALSAAAELAALLPPVPDQRERAEADELPADEQLQRVVGDDEREHRRGEEAEHRVVVREADVVVHVGGGVDVHEQRDQRDDEEHHHREAVDAGADAELRRSPFCHQVMRVHDRCDDGLGRVRRAGEQARPECRETLAVTGGVVDAVDPLDDRDAPRARTRCRRQRSRSPRPSSACCFPKKRIRRNETAGIAGMIQA